MTDKNMYYRPEWMKIKTTLYVLIFTSMINIFWDISNNVLLLSVQLMSKDKYQLTAIAYATKHVPILKLLNCTDDSIKQQAFVYAASNGSLDALEFMLTDHNYSTVDINGIDFIHGETGNFLYIIIKSISTKFF